MFIPIAWVGSNPGRRSPWIKSQHFNRTIRYTPTPSGAIHQTSFQATPLLRTALPINNAPRAGLTPATAQYRRHPQAAAAPTAFVSTPHPAGPARRCKAFSPVSWSKPGDLQMTHLLLSPSGGLRQRIAYRPRPPSADTTVREECTPHSWCSIRWCRASWTRLAARQCGRLRFLTFGPALMPHLQAMPLYRSGV
jgi:hypothetical protein